MGATESNVTANEIIYWVKENFSGDYIIELTDKLEIIIKGSCMLHNSELKKLKYKFLKVDGDFNIGGHSMDQTSLPLNYKLETLENCPDEVTGHFACPLCENLKSLVGGPKIVGKNYKVSHCDLRTLDGIANKVGGYIKAYCNENLNDITALKSSEFKKADLEYCSERLYNSDDYLDLCVKGKIVYGG